VARVGGWEVGVKEGVLEERGRWCSEVLSRASRAVLISLEWGVGVKGIRTGGEGVGVGGEGIGVGVKYIC
jgi:hypothetical protein